jgi:hypothetical protein
VVRCSDVVGKNRSFSTLCFYSDYTHLNDMRGWFGACPLPPVVVDAEANAKDKRQVESLVITAMQLNCTLRHFV